VVSTCSYSGQSSTSNVFAVGINPFYNCYCSSVPSSTADEEIYSVTVNGATNALACGTAAPGAGSIAYRYSNFRTLGSLTSMTQGQVVSFSIDQNECDGATYFSNGLAIWIDFNQNGSFADAGEQVFVEGATATGPRTINGTFTIPAGAPTGLTGMRIIDAEGYSGASLTPCLSYGYGETEDYLVTITPPVPMTFTSASVQQQTGNVSAGTIGAVLRIKVVTDGTLSPLSLDGFNMSTNGTTNTSDIITARVYATGSNGGNAAFAGAVAAAAPYGTYYYPNSNFDITGSYTLASGNNYFWLAYETVPSRRPLQAEIHGAVS